MKRIRKGSIVVVIEGSACGNEAGTITKVLAKSTRVADSVMMATGKAHHNSYNSLILCKPLGEWKEKCNNAPCVYEFVSDLRLANETEKSLFRANGCKPIKIPEYV